QPSQTRPCRRVVRLGANTLHGASAACPKRRVRRRTGARPPCAKLPGPSRRPGKEKGSFERNASPGFYPPHAASRTLFRTKKSVRSAAHYVSKAGARLGWGREDSAPPRLSAPRWLPSPAPAKQKAPPPSCFGERRRLAVFVILLPRPQGRS